MALRGCIDVRGLPLQVLLRDNPGWVGLPVAVTRDERPQSPILALNGRAREKGLRPGMKYSSALSLVPGLRARAVPHERIAQARELVTRVLCGFTPDIEPCPFDHDAAWASVEGMRSLFESEARWVELVKAALLREGLMASIVVGFTRFGTYAIARSSRSRTAVFFSREEERRELERSPIDILPLPQRARSTLQKLEVRTVRQLLALPEGDLARRFGREAGLLRQALLTDDPLPIQQAALRQREPSLRRLDSPVSRLDLLMPHVEQLLAQEVSRAAADREVIAGCAVTLLCEGGEVTRDVIRPAAPTLKTAVLQRLTELRLSARQFTSGVVQVEIRSARARPSRTQGELFTVRGRDLEAGARAFAAIRARFGNSSVACAQPCDSHVPERSFRWAALHGPVPPGAVSERFPSSRPQAVRRIFFVPEPIPSREVGGPSFLLSGSWWGSGEDAPCQREYSFDSSAHGIRWLYRDGLTGTSWVQGVVD